MQWIYSRGGPLILLSEENLQEWMGARSDDYSRACNVDDYVGLIDVGEGKGLILGDEPMQTAWLPSNPGHGGILVRWVYADDEGTVIRHLRKLPEKVFEATNLVFSVTGSKAFLFDSAISGSSVRKDDYLLIQLEPGDYSIQNGFYNRNDDISLILHKLYPR